MADYYRFNQNLFYSNKDGNIGIKKNKKVIYFCDGIICGEGEGSLEPTPHRGGIVSGINPLYIDLAISELMNFNYRKNNQISKPFNLKKMKLSEFKPNDLRVVSNNNTLHNKKLYQFEDVFNFKPSSGWENYIEKSNFPIRNKSNN